MISIPDNMDEESIGIAEFLLNKTFVNKKISELNLPDDSIDKNIQTYQFIFETVIQILNEYAKGNITKRSVCEGASRLLNQPEYHDVDKALQILSKIENGLVVDATFKHLDNLDFNVSIGKSDDVNEDVAVISARYTINGKDVGTAGVIGPVRMDYNKVFSVLDCITKMLSTVMIEDKNMLPKQDIGENETNGK